MVVYLFGMGANWYDTVLDDLVYKKRLGEVTSAKALVVKQCSMWNENMQLSLLKMDEVDRGEKSWIYRDLMRFFDDPVLQIIQGKGGGGEMVPSLISTATFFINMVSGLNVFLANCIENPIRMIYTR